MKNLMISLSVLVPLLLLIPVDANARSAPLPLTAQACDNCDYQEAKDFAKNFAARNTCRRTGNTRGGSRGDSCPLVTQPILIASINNKAVYKFNVITSVNRYNLERVEAIAKTPSTSDLGLMDEFFDEWETLQEVMHNAGQRLQTTLNNSPALGNISVGADTQQSFQPLSSAQMSNSMSDACSSHFINFFTEAGRISMDLQIRAKLNEAFAGKSYDDVTKQDFITSGGITVGRDSVGVTIGTDFVKENQLFMTIDRSLTDELMFDVQVFKGLNGKVKYAFGLNRAASFVGGIKVSNLLSPRDIDYTNVNINPCIKEWLELQPEIRPTPNSIGGDGSIGDPKTFDNGLFGGELFCQRTVKYTICTTDLQDQTSNCTVSTYTFVTSCR